jgi:hypothetical protein
VSKVRINDAWFSRYGYVVLRSGHVLMAFGARKAWARHQPERVGKRVGRHRFPAPWAFKARLASTVQRRISEHRWTAHNDSGFNTPIIFNSELQLHFASYVRLRCQWRVNGIEKADHNRVALGHF